VVGCWHGYLSGARFRLAYGPADATAFCFSKIQIGFTFVVPAHPGSPGKGPLNGCVCACVLSFHTKILLYFNSELLIFAYLLAVVTR